MFRFFFNTLPIFLVGIYFGLRCSHWLGADVHQSLIDGIVVAEQSVHEMALWLKNWVFSFFGGVQE